MQGTSGGNKDGSFNTQIDNLQMLVKEFKQHADEQRKEEVQKSEF